MAAGSLVLACDCTSFMHIALLRVFTGSGAPVLCPYDIVAFHAKFCPWQHPLTLHGKVTVPGAGQEGARPLASLGLCGPGIKDSMMHRARLPALSSFQHRSELPGNGSHRTAVSAVVVVSTAEDRKRASQLSTIISSEFSWTVEQITGLVGVSLVAQVRPVGCGESGGWTDRQLCSAQVGALYGRDCLAAREYG